MLSYRFLVAAINVKNSTFNKVQNLFYLNIGVIYLICNDLFDLI